MNKMLPQMIPNILRGDDKLQTNFYVSIFLAAILASFGVGATVYSYSIFLSSYPISWIPYWMIVESILIFVLGSILSLFNPYNFQKYAQIILSIISISVVASLILIQQNWYWAPFIVVLILRSSSNIMAAAVWSLLPTIFYYRQFKELANRFTIASSLGAIIAPVILVAISVSFGISTLLFFLLLCLISGILAIKFTTNIVNPTGVSQDTQIAVSAFRYPLFRTVLLISLILTILYGLGEFLLRMQLGLSFNQAQIIVFMSVFMSVANLISLCTQIIFPKIFSRFKFYLILQSLFLLIAACAGAYWISPTIWPAVILGGIKIVFENGWVGIIRRNVVNIFPPAVMSKNELYVRTYISAIGTIIAAILAMFSTHLTLFLQYFALIFIILSLVGIALSYMLFKQYLSTLKKMVIITGFSYAAEHNLDDLQKLVSETLCKPDVNSLEVSLVTPKLFKTPPDSFYEILSHSHDESVKTIVLQILQQYPHDELNFNRLTELYHERDLLSEKNREQILKLLSNIHSKGLLKEARNRLEKHPLSKNALLILLKHGDTKDYMYALEATLKLAYSNDLSQRIIAAKLLYTLGAGRFYDLKSKLLTDEETLVRVLAFHHLPAKDVQFMLPSLAKFLNRNVIKILHNRFELRELTNLAERLMRLYWESKDEYALSAMAFITPIKNQHLEKYVIEFLAEKNTFYRTSLSKDILQRKKIITFSSELKEALHNALIYETKLIKEYRKFLNHPSLVNIQGMLNNRINYALQRFLLWYAAYHHDTASIYSSISRLTAFDVIHEARNVQDKIIEFLMSNETSLEIRNLIEEIFEIAPSNIIKFPQLQKPINFEHDPWLSKVINQYSINESNEMNPLQRAIALQKTEFFESLPEEVLFELGQTCKLLDCEQNEIIIKEGDEGDTLYVLVQGELWVYKNQNLLATITPIKCIGEMALFGDTKRTTTVKVKERSLLLTLSKDDFMMLTNEFPQILHSVIPVIIQRFVDQMSILEGKISENTD